MPVTRAAKALELFGELYAIERALPPLGTAIGYASNNWDALTRVSESRGILAGRDGAARCGRGSGIVALTSREDDQTGSFSENGMRWAPGIHPVPECRTSLTLSGPEVGRSGANGVYSDWRAASSRV